MGAAAVFESGDCADELCNARKVADLLLSQDARQNQLLHTLYIWSSNKKSQELCSMVVIMSTTAQVILSIHIRLVLNCDIFWVIINIHLIFFPYLFHSISPFVTTSVIFFFLFPTPIHSKLFNFHKKIQLLKSF